MNQLGLQVWCPNLDEDSASLYNSAHRISALTTFTELASTTAYAYLGIDPTMAGDLTLLIPAYDHFVHYLQYENYRKELKEEGKVAKDAAHKRFSKNRERASEQNPSAQGSRRRIRRLPRTPVMSTSLVAPKGLAIDYYGPKWYNKLDLAQQKKIPNRSILAFLSNASESLQPKDERHPDEKLSTRSFTKKYWEVLAEPYGLVLGDSSDSDDDDPDGKGGNHGGSDKEGEGIDLTAPSDDSGDEFYEEGDAGSLYDDDDGGEGFVNDEDEEEDNEDEDDEDDEEWYEGKLLDGDCKMADIPKGEEKW
ncbi:hypothetical protein Pst134EA_001031 [Puccinia striiformis f. sp. tritici]|uniref:hypothetical protein n=1 Tax=Puccinia striiformis f. sp. tritici TaxID=168172 RepID=UPI002008455E|nr:hypothetical protein Pst134EA_001031 [Puccinia striiformis f. sp. tritici]KAH9473976.1 hypothetical protein Pst134EA_001031 [Puccinia striiformis f. sp. tritici]